MRISRLRLLLACLVAFSVSCSSDSPVTAEETPQDAPALTISIQSGAGQEARQFEWLPEPVTVLVQTDEGQPAADQAVTATSTDESDQIEATARTDSNGLVQFDWKMGEDFRRTVTFTVEDASTQTTATATYRYFGPRAVSDGWTVSDLDESSDGTQRLFEGVDHIRRNAYPGIHSMVIVQGGALRFELYLEGNDSQGRFWDWTSQTPHEQQSASKSFRSALVGLAVDRGLLTVDTPVKDLFPDYASSFVDGKEDITVQDFLTMSSGLDWNEAGAAAGQTNNNLSQMYSQNPGTWTGYVFNRPLAFTPGTQFVYNTGASLLLDDMVVRASGRTLADFVYDNYYDLIGSHDTPGGPNPENGALKTPREMAKLGQIYLDRGMWQDTRILSEAWVEDSFVERMTPSPGIGYGYQWWMRTLSTDQASYRVKYASGNGGQFIMIVDELDLVIVSTGGNFGSSTMNQFHTIAESYVLPAFE